MKKNILTIILTMSALTNFVKADVHSSQIGQSIKTLQAAKSVQIDQNYADAFHAYVILMKTGKEGFDALANEWAYGSIPEENWISWNSDYSTRFTPDSWDVLKAYNIFLIEKYKGDKKFSLAVIKRYKTQKIYDGGRFFVDTLTATDATERGQGYYWLTELFPGIPPFTYDAVDDQRAKQLQDIRAFLNNSK